MTKDQFIEKVYGIAFGSKRFRKEHYGDRNFTHSEVIKMLEEHKEDSFKWHCIPDDDREELVNAFNEEGKD